MSIERPAGKVTSKCTAVRREGGFECPGEPGWLYLADRKLNIGGKQQDCVWGHPTTGGVTASWATQADVVLAEPGALIGFAGRRVIEQTIKQKLPKDFQTAEYLLEHGFIDQIVDRGKMKGFLSKVLSYWKTK